MGLDIYRPNRGVDPENPTVAVSVTVAELGSALGFRSVSDISHQTDREICLRSSPLPHRGPGPARRHLPGIARKPFHPSVAGQLKEGRSEALKQPLKHIGQGGYR
jgi:hypothetical protein